ncbi:hypothetical protein ON010_g16324 [Phytophthora cinnamomi]|nr:hypothetical protein ON010_g16324 [Phytophthora cinnamomi]
MSSRGHDGRVLPANKAYSEHTTPEFYSSITKWRPAIVREVMQHVWFQDIKWELLEAKDASVVVPYDPIADYNAARIRTPPTRNESLSSAESIDPEDNAKYFADF